MKKVVGILSILTFLFLGSCQIFEDCDGASYQIKSKIEIIDRPGYCRYKAESIASCLIWNDQKEIKFTDTCTVYEKSQVVQRKELYEKYGI